MFFQYKYFEKLKKYMKVHEELIKMQEEGLPKITLGKHLY